MHKRGQVSIFLIVAIVLALGTIVGYYLYTSTKEKAAETKAAEFSQRNSQAAQFKSFFEECIQKTSYEGLKLLGMQGGYIMIPPSFDEGGVAYWQYDSANVQPFLNGTQQEFLGYLEEHVAECVDDNAISEQGFSLRKGNISAHADFGDTDVTVVIEYALTVSLDDFSATYSEFTQRLEIPYRRIFEAATELNKHVLLPAFDPSAPLEGAPQYGYFLEYERKGEGKFIFKVIDRASQTPDGVPYTISFAAKLGLSPLIKRTTLQNLSSTQPTPYDFEINSPDNRAVLFIARDTTITKEGQGVPSIDVKQAAEEQVVSSNVPNAKKNKDIVGRQDIPYVTDHTIYNFEPDGLLFSQPQKLTIKYDDNGKIAGGVGMLQGHNGFWFPLRSVDDKERREVTAYISGFTDFTAVDCGTQMQKTVSAEHHLEPSAICYVSLAVTIATLAMTAYSIINTPLINAEGTTVALSAQVESASIVEASGFFQRAGAQMTNFFGLGYAVGASTATAIGIGLLAFGGLQFIAGVADPTVFYEDAPENCQTYVPTCQQAINIQKEEEDGTGKCVPEGRSDTQAGQPSTLCAQVEKCDFLNSFLCMPCSVKCTSSYK